MEWKKGRGGGGMSLHSLLLSRKLKTLVRDRGCLVEGRDGTDG